MFLYLKDTRNLGLLYPSNLCTASPSNPTSIPVLIGHTNSDWACEKTQ